MIRLLRGPSPSTAALVRLAAFVIALVSVVVIPSALAAAAAGHASVSAAFTTTGLAAGLTLVMALAARSLDPLRR